VLTYFRCVDGKVEKLDRFTLEALSDPKALHWVDLDTPTPEQARILEDPFRFHPLAIEDCLVDVNHPKVEFPVIGPKATVYFRDIYDNLYRIVDASYQYHDMIQGLLDAYLSVVNNRLNETMKRLAAIGAVFGAVTVIAGIYGMNFEHMPELHWRYGYPFALGLMVSVSAGLLWWFRRKQWI
jgi:Mg2+ and Co2+ transporter CorA